MIVDYGAEKRRRMRVGRGMSAGQVRQLAAGEAPDGPRFHIRARGKQTLRDGCGTVAGSEMQGRLAADQVTA